MWLTDHIALVGSGALGFGFSHPSDCHVYLVDGGSELALIDAGCGLDTASLVGRIRGAGIDADRLRTLFLTHAHADHAGGAADLVHELGVTVAASPEVATIVRSGDQQAAGVDVGQAQGVYPPGYEVPAVPVETALVDDAEVRVGSVRIRAIATPGHASGHLSFLVSTADRRDLFTGDTLFYGGRIALQDTWDCDLRAHVESLRRLGELEFDGLFPAHLMVSVRDGQRHVQAAVATLDRGGIPGSIADLA